MGSKMTVISRNKNVCSRLGKLMSYTRATDRQVALGGVSPLVSVAVLGWGGLWVVRGLCVGVGEGEGVRGGRGGLINRRR